MEGEQEAVAIKIVGAEDLRATIESINDSLGQLEAAATESLAHALEPIEGIITEQLAWTELTEALGASITASCMPPSMYTLGDIALSLPHIRQLPAEEHREVVSLLERAQIIDEEGTRGIATLTVTNRLILRELQCLTQSQRHSHYRMLALTIVAVVVSIASIVLGLLL